MHLTLCSCSSGGCFQNPDRHVPSVASLCPQLSNVPTCSAELFLPQMGPLPTHAMWSCSVSGAHRQPGLPQMQPLLCACRSESSSSPIQMVLSPFSPSLLAWQSFSPVPLPLAHPSIKCSLNPCRVPSTVLSLQGREGNQAVSHLLELTS